MSGWGQGGVEIHLGGIEFFFFSTQVCAILPDEEHSHINDCEIDDEYNSLLDDSDAEDTEENLTPPHVVKDSPPRQEMKLVDNFAKK